MSKIQSLTDDLEITARQINSVARLDNTIRDVASWRNVLLDLVGQAQRNLIALYKTIGPSPAELEQLESAETAAFDAHEGRCP